ncbi:unnamed protein product, partial [Hapterophycus canaliculatus]
LLDGSASETAFLKKACGRGEEAVLSLLTDPAPTTTWRFPGLLEARMQSQADQVSAIRSSQGAVLGVAGCHFWVISAARALLGCRREAAVSSSSPPPSSSPSSSGGGGAAATTAGVPAASSMLRSRRLAEFLYEMELRRSGRVAEARSAVRRLLASLLFWLPPSPPPLPRSSLMSAGAAAPAAAAASAATPRPPGYGKLPRPVAGHEKTALSQFQRVLSRQPATAKDAPDEHTPARARACPPQSLLCVRKAGEEISSASGAVPQHGLSEIEESLWLRVFGAVERHAMPCRAEPRQGPTPAHLVPLEKAVAAIENIFGGEAKSAVMAAATKTAATMAAANGSNRRR